MPRYALITGASSGLGLALAEALARRGRNLLLVARTRTALESVACELTQRFGIEVLFRVCDLSEPLQLSGLLHELEQGERQIDLLVNDAGIGVSGPLIEQDWGRLQEQIEVNVLALTRLCHAFGQHMTERGGGQILNVAALDAFHPGAWMSSYHASKAYVLNFSEGLRDELKSKGVRVSVLCPGPIRTAFRDKSGIAANDLSTCKRALSAEEVALVAVRALEKNRGIIVPGWRNRLLGLSCRLAPRWLVNRLAARRNRLAMAG